MPMVIYIGLRISRHIHSSLTDCGKNITEVTYINVSTYFKGSIGLRYFVMCGKSKL